MSIAPPSDIVLDAARAADPSKYQAAAARLSRMGGTAVETPDASGWTATLEASLEAADNPAVTGTPRFSLQETPGREAVSTTANTASQRIKADPFKQFEAFVLQNFIQLMLPEQAKNVYGGGTAGHIWKSLLAEKLGSQLAAHGGIGIAARLAKDARRKQESEKTAAASVSGGALAQTLPYLQDALRIQGQTALLAAPSEKR